MPLRSTVAGSALGAVAMVFAAAAAIWSSGHFEAFARDRGMLQLVVAIPLATLATAWALAYFRMLSARQMLWAMLPVAGLILAGAGALGLDYRALPWTLGLSSFLFVPWMVGLFVGSRLARRRSERAAAARAAG